MEERIKCPPCLFAPLCFLASSHLRRVQCGNPRSSGEQIIWKPRRGSSVGCTIPASGVWCIRCVTGCGFFNFQLYRYFGVLSWVVVPDSGEQLAEGTR